MRRESRKRREKMVEGIVLGGAVLIPCIRLGSQAGVKSCLSTPSPVILSLRTRCVLVCVSVAV